MHGKMVYLRILEETDILRTQQWINDPELNELMGYLPITRRQQEQWYETTVGSTRKFVFAVCTQEDDEHIGNVSLGNIDYINSNGMLAVFLAAPEKRSRGFGTEAVLLLLEFAFRRLNLHSVYLKTSDYLTDAIRFYSKIGFVQEGVLRQHEYKQGRFVDKLLFSMLRSEFEGKYGKPN